MTCIAFCRHSKDFFEFSLVLHTHSQYDSQDDSSDIDDPDAADMDLPEPVKAVLEEYRECVWSTSEKSKKSLECRQKAMQVIYDTIQAGGNEQKLLEEVVSFMLTFIDQRRENLKKNVKRLLRKCGEKGEEAKTAPEKTKVVPEVKTERKQ